MEGHCIVRDFDSIQQLGFVAKWNFLGGRNDLLEAPASKWAARVLRAALLYRSCSRASLSCFDIGSIQPQYFRLVIAPSFSCQRRASFF
jgi:hypothetical protein